MIPKIFFFIFIFFGIVELSKGQNRDQKIKIADSILNVRGEVYFNFSSDYLTPTFHQFLSIHKIKDSRVFAYANKSGFKIFLAANLDFHLQPENFTASRLKRAELSSIDLVYPSFDEYKKLLDSFESKYNQYCRIDEIGKSVQGRELLILKISSPFGEEKRKPAVLLASSIHGNELTGYKLLLWLAEYLLENYNKNELVTNLMDKAEIWIYPLANPDGTFFGGNATVAQAKRFNANNLDLNRNYPDPDEGSHPDGSDWQPENVAVMNFHRQRDIVLSAVLHTGEEVINYPWDTWSRQHADNDWYKQISREYVDSAHLQNPEYLSGFDNGTVNGYKWYRITGGQQDFVNYYLHSRELTLELSTEDMPDSINLTRYWKYNRQSLLRFIEQSLYGIKGIVSDAESGLPLYSKIELLKHDKDNSWVYSDSIDGSFYRLLAPGQYTLSVSATGYSPIERDFTLKESELIEFQLTLNSLNDEVIVYPNPFRQKITLLFNKNISLTGSVKLMLIDMSGKVLFLQQINVSGNKISEVYLPKIPDGIYILKLESPEFVKQIELLKMD